MYILHSQFKAKPEANSMEEEPVYLTSSCSKCAAKTLHPGSYSGYWQWRR